MSRCFPYPPPGYTLSGDRKEALIDSIKLQKGRVKSEEQRKKEKRREKKEKRKENKNKTHHNQEKSDVIQGHIGEKSWAADTKPKLLHRGSKAEAEHLERSSLTEEHGESVRLPSTSSDSTENSNKRKRQPSPVDSTRGRGKIIRIRLSKKQNCADAPANEQQVCSTSGRTNFPSEIQDDNMSKDLRCKLKGNNNINYGLSHETAREQISMSSQQIEPVAARKMPMPYLTNSVMTLAQINLLEYKNLIENGVPSQLECGLPNTDDLDWLVPCKKQGLHSEKKQISGNDRISCCGSSTLWPQARYLQEVDMYALPYTIPL